MCACGCNRARPNKGMYGGRKSGLAPAAPMAARMPTIGIRERPREKITTAIQEWYRQVMPSSGDDVSQDEMDAILVAQWALQLLSGKPELPEYHAAE